MQIDWFTIFAQIVNFLILVFLLKRFLYGPIISAMDRREQRVTDRLREAEARETEAEEHKEEFQRKSHDLDQKRKKMLDEAREEADEHRKELLQEARQDIADRRARWRDELAHEKESFLGDLRQQAAGWIARATRRALRDLADVDLQAQIVAMFQERLCKMDEDDLERLADALRESDESLRIVTSFEMSEEQQESLIETLRERSGESVKPVFAVSADLVCGIEIRTSDKILAWSLDFFLGDLEEEIDEALRNVTLRQDRSSDEASRTSEASEDERDTEDVAAEDEASDDQDSRESEA